MLSRDRVQHAYGFLRYAFEYLDGYTVIAKERPDFLDLLSVKSYLIAHTIELAYKAMLYAQGVSEETLKKKYGHNLTLISIDANVLMRSENLYQLNGDDSLVIGAMNHLYQSKSFEYIQTGAKFIYEPEKFSALAKKICDSVSGYLEDRMVEFSNK